MKIQNYNNINSYYYQNRLAKNSSWQNNYNTYEQKNIVFNSINLHRKLNKHFFIKLLNINPIYNFKNFTKEEYLKLSQSELSRLRSDFNNLPNSAIKETFALLHIYASKCLKTTFDERFGEGNYVVISIGRSLSSITKALSLEIGKENVINIPMSNTNRFYTNPSSLEDFEKLIKYVEKNENLGKFLKYLKKNKLSKIDIENSKKNYILIDYCYTGKSLKGAEDLFKSNLVWGNRDNVYSVDFLKLIENFENSNYLDEIKKVTNNEGLNNTLRLELILSRFKKFSPIKTCFNLGDVSQASKKKNRKSISKIIKLYWFNFLDKSFSKGEKLEIQKISNEFFENKPFNYQIPNQNVELWHDSTSQYQSDISNDLREINKILIKYKNKKSVSETSYELKKEITDLYGVHNYLSSILYITSLQNQISYYQIRSDINNLINQTNIDLENII